MTEKSSLNARENTLRDAGVLERFCKTGYDLGIHSCVIVSASYSHQNLVLDRHTLFPALRDVIQQHPMLCVQFSGKAATELHWVRVPSLNLDNIVVFSNKEIADLESVVTDEFAQHRERGRLWRVIVLRDGTVVFAYHHGIGDGRSGLIFHQSLLAALNARQANPPENIDSDYHDMPTPDNLTLERPVEDSTNVAVPISSFFRMFLEKRVFPRSWLPETSAWTGHPCASEPHMRVNVRVRKIPASQSKALLALCRTKKTTLTGFLNTLAHYVWSHLVHDISNAGPTKYTHISMSVAFDLREITGCPESRFTIQSSGDKVFVPLLDASLPYPPTQTSFPWDEATELCRSLPDRRRKSLQGIGLLRLLYRWGDSDGFLLDLLGKKRDNTFGISNLGRLVVPSAGSDSAGAGASGWAIGEASFFVCDATTGAPMSMSLVGSPSGSITISYAWGDGAVDNEVADAFVDGIHKGIESVLRS